MNTVKALIVDDEFNVRDVIRHLGQWETHGITKLLEAKNGHEAKSLIEKERPEIIFYRRENAWYGRNRTD